MRREFSPGRRQIELQSPAPAACASRRARRRRVSDATVMRSNLNVYFPSLQIKNRVARKVAKIFKVAACSNSASSARFFRTCRDWSKSRKPWICRTVARRSGRCWPGRTGSTAVTNQKNARPLPKSAKLLSDWMLLCCVPLNYPMKVAEQKPPALKPALTARERFVRAAHCQPVERPPVWLMRQAGRALPEYRKLKETYTFVQLVQNPCL